MQLILHIGTEKTGSTSLQQWLDLNDEALQANGVFYSAALGRVDNREISIYARDTDKPMDGFAQRGIDSPEKHAAFRRNLESLLAREVEHARRSGCRAFVISSEHLHSQIVTPEMVGRVRALVEPPFDDIKVVCYLRSQASLLQSRISVGIRGSMVGPHELRTFEEESYYDYLSLYRRWSAHFPNCDFRPFVRCRNVIEDLCADVAVNAGDYSPPPRSNGALDYRAGLIAYQLANDKRVGTLPGRFRHIPVDHLPAADAVRISRSLAAEINEKYRQSNEELVRLCPNLEMFDLEDRPEAYPIEGNASRMFEDWVAGEHMAFAIATMNTASEFSNLSCALADAELGMIRGDHQRAREILDDVAGRIEDLDIAIAVVGGMDAQPLRDRLHRLRA